MHGGVLACAHDVDPQAQGDDPVDPGTFGEGGSRPIRALGQSRPLASSPSTFARLREPRMEMKLRP
jgi:hypothetical protein